MLYETPDFNNLKDLIRNSSSSFSEVIKDLRNMIAGGNTRQVESPNAAYSACMLNFGTMLESSRIAYDDMFTGIMQQLPMTMVNSLAEGINICLPKLPNRNWTYEEILKFFMDCASEMNSFHKILGAPWVLDNMHELNKGLEMFLHLIDKSYRNIETDIIPLKPVALALLWALLLVCLVEKYTGSCTDSEKANIAKLAISIVLSLFAGFTGYVHSGGFTGLPPVTSYIRTYYNAQKRFENAFPYYYGKVPRFLKFKNCRDFDDLTYSLQRDAGCGLNIAYTFRVGDSLLENLSGHNYISDDVLRQTLRSLWPLPSEYEAKKMYRIYSNEKVYHL